MNFVGLLAAHSLKLRKKPPAEPTTVRSGWHWKGMERDRAK